MLHAQTNTSQHIKSFRALFSVSVNTAADWKSLYLNDNDSVNASAVKASQVSQQHLRSPPAEGRPSMRRWADIERLAPWNRNAEAAGHSRGMLWHSDAVPLAAKRATQDHRACQTSTLDVPTIKNNLEVLSEHVPSFCFSQSQLSPSLLIRLSEDMPAVFARLAALRAVLPANDISSMIGLRPELLLGKVFEGVAPALDELAGLYPGADIPRVVERQPYLLIPECKALVLEMMRERLLPFSMAGYVGDELAANQVERILMHVQSSAIQGTQTFQADRKRVLEGCCLPVGMPQWEDIP